MSKNYDQTIRAELAQMMCNKTTNAEASRLLARAQFKNNVVLELQELIISGEVDQATMSTLEQRNMIGRSFKRKQAAGELEWPLFDWFVEFFGPLPEDINTEGG